MSTPVTIRNMRQLDLSRVMQIELECFTMPWSEATFRGLLRRSDADLIVAETDGQVVGYAAFWSVLDQGELGNVSVTAKWRRQGIANRLIRVILNRAFDRSVREVYLEVRVSNLGAQDLYRAHGFEEVGRRRNYYLEPVEDALVMKRQLDVVPRLIAVDSG